MNKPQYPPLPPPVLHVNLKSTFSQLALTSKFDLPQNQLFELIQTKVFPHVQPPFVQKIYELNEVLIFEETPPDLSISVCPLELFLHPFFFLTLILFFSENINERLVR